MERFIKISDVEILENKKLIQSGFSSGFNWRRLVETEIVVGIFENDQLVGLVAFSRNYKELYNKVKLLEVSDFARGQGYGAKLVAVVMWDSFNQPGFEGFVSLTTKTNGVEKFYAHLGAEIFGKKAIFLSNTSRYVIKKYLEIEV